MNARERLEEELNKTGVISESFKRHIMGLALNMMSEAYTAGRKSVAQHVTPPDNSNHSVKAPDEPESFGELIARGFDKIREKSVSLHDLIMEANERHEDE